jgi:hypothetical protein
MGRRGNSGRRWRRRRNELMFGICYYCYAISNHLLSLRNQTHLAL